MKTTGVWIYLPILLSAVGLAVVESLTNNSNLTNDSTSLIEATSRPQSSVEASGVESTSSKNAGDTSVSKSTQQNTLTDVSTSVTDTSTGSQPESSTEDTTTGTPTTDESSIDTGPPGASNTESSSAESSGATTDVSILPDGSESSGSGATAAAVSVTIVLLLLGGIAVLLYFYIQRRDQRHQKLEVNTAEKGAVVENGRELKQTTIPSIFFSSADDPVSICQSEDSFMSDPGRPLSTAIVPIRPQSEQPRKSSPANGRVSRSTWSEAFVYKCDDDFFDSIKRHQGDLMLYQKEFDSLSDGSHKSTNVARTQENNGKNRYANILPYDDDRVCLPKKQPDDSDYINASYIDGAKKKRAYIASQGPTSATLADFWLMIWDNGCSRIVMVTNLEESVRGFSTVKSSKCAKYWPSGIGEETKHGEIAVRLLSESIFTDWTIRTFAVRKEESDSVRIVQQYHYTTWPDQDVPHTSTALLEFHRLALKSPDVLSASGPILVHCSAGVGRTGTLIAIDLLEDSWNETQPRCDVFGCVEQLRQQRMQMVQSVRQYMFIHHSLIQVFRVGDSAELKPAAMEFYKMTPQHKEQFRIIEAVSVTQLYHCSVAKSKPHKNRSESILPANSSIRFLKAVKEDDNIYINAVPVHGSRGQNSFLVTQMPLQSTINDFWRLVRDNECSMVIMLNSDFKPDERYWPDDDNGVMKTKSFDIRKSGSGSQLLSDDILATDLKIGYIGNLKRTGDDSSSEEEEDSTCEDETGSSENVLPETSDDASGQTSGDQAKIPWVSVRQLRVSNWPEADQFPRDPSLLLTIYEQITQVRVRQPKNPIVVHCLYGSSRSGLLCALVNVLDRLKERGVVGIFDAVKLIKSRRQEFIPDVDHYDYLHQLVCEYIKRNKDLINMTPPMTSRSETKRTTQYDANEQSAAKTGGKKNTTIDDVRHSHRNSDARLSSKTNDVTQNVRNSEIKQSVTPKSEEQTAKGESGGVKKAEDRQIVGVTDDDKEGDEKHTVANRADDGAEKCDKNDDDDVVTRHDDLTKTT